MARCEAEKRPSVFTVRLRVPARLLLVRRALRVDVGGASLVPLGLGVSPEIAQEYGEIFLNPGIVRFQLCSSLIFRHAFVHAARLEVGEGEIQVRFGEIGLEADG